MHLVRMLLFYCCCLPLVVCAQCVPGQTVVSIVKNCADCPEIKVATTHNGQCKPIAIERSREGKLEGEREIYDSNGIIKRIETYVQGELRYAQYYDSIGRLSSEGGYENGKYSGCWIFYYADGKVLKKGNYYQGKLVDIWEFFDKDGCRFSTILYQEDRMIKHIFIAPELLN
ncbi:MAG: hypothetical protein SFW35_00810 [Chitinophagales bacterium]|nr:hypothetical protein [Chitinophagales bacterium]